MKLLLSTPLGFALFFSASCLMAQQSGPNWWYNPASSGDPVAMLPVATSDENHQMANIGQAKWMAYSAYEEMEALASGSAALHGIGESTAEPGFQTLNELYTLLASPSSQSDSANYAPLNQGQLKTMAAPFYERFAEMQIVPRGPDGSRLVPDSPFYSIYPWTDTTIDDMNYAPVTLGQLKWVFSFALDAAELGYDTDLDGMADAWEALIVDYSPTDAYEGIEDVLELGDFDNDGVTNLDEYLAGTNPLVANALTLSKHYAFDELPPSTDWIAPDAVLNSQLAGGAKGTANRGSVSYSGGGAVPFELSLEFYNKRTRVWIEWSVKATDSQAADYADFPEVQINRAVRVRTNTSGAVEVYNGYERVPADGQAGRWMEVHTPVTPDPTVWRTYALYIDFGNRHWQLLIDGTQVIENLGFDVDGPGFFARFALVSDDAADAYDLDEVRLQTQDTGFMLVDSDGDGRLDIDETVNTSKDLYDSDFDQVGDHLDSVPNDFDIHAGFMAFPYASSFQAFTTGQSVDGQFDWTASGNATIVSAQPIIPFNTLVLDGAMGTAEASIKTATYGLDTVYLNLYASLQSGTLTPLSSTDGRIYAFELDSGGLLSVWNGTAWQTAPGLGSLHDQWRNYSVLIDFQARTWDMLVDGETVFSQLPFLDPAVRSLEEIKLVETAGVLKRIAFVSLDYFPVYPDRDNDGMLDAWELIHFGDTYQRAAEDFDRDGISNGDEFTANSDPTNAHENHSIVPDGVTPPGGLTFTASLPFTENFSAYSLGQSVDEAGNWTLEGAASGGIVEGLQPDAVNGNLLLLTMSGGGGALSHYFDLNGVMSVWLDYYIQPAIAATLPGDPSAINVTAVCFQEEGSEARIHYFDGDQGWVPADADLISANDWVRITIHQDYTSQTWSLYQDGKRIMEGRPFSHAAPEFYVWALDEDALLDDIVIGETKPANLDDDADGLTNEQEDINGDGNVDVYEDLNGNGVLDDGEDIDGDGVLDLIAETDPNNADTDGDFVSDYIELLQGSDPLDPLSTGAYARLPVKYDFEGYAAGSLNGIDGWETGGSGTVVDDTTTPGNNFLVIADDTVTSYAVHPLSPSTLSSEVYVTFRAALSPADLTGITAAISDKQKANCLIALNDQGKFAAYDGVNGRWLTSESDTVFDGIWKTYELAINTLTQTWGVSADQETLFEGIPLNDQAHHYLGYFGVYYRGISAGDSILLDDVTISHDKDTVFDQAPALPYAESFAGMSGGISIVDVDDNWTLAGNGAVAAVFDAGGLDGDGVSMYVEAGTEPAVLSREIAPQSAFLTVSYLTRPTLIDLGTTPMPAITPGVPADYCFDANGTMYLSNGQSWLALEGMTFNGLDPVELRFVYDIAGQTWRLDIDQVTVAEGLSFASALPQLDRITLVQHSGNTFVDAINAAVGSPPRITLIGVASGQTSLITGHNVTLEAVVSDVDEDNYTRMEVAFYSEFAGQLSPTIGANNVGYVSQSYAPATYGMLPLYALVTDADGLVARSQTLAYTVSDDGDTDGLPDGWEQLIIDADSNDLITSAADVLGTDDFDQDGHSNAAELAAGSDPTDYYNIGHPDWEVVPVVTIVSGDGQSDVLGNGRLEHPLVIEVRDTAGNPLYNAPVHIDPRETGALVDSTDNPFTGYDSVTVTTDPDPDPGDGIYPPATATVYLQP